MEELNFRQLISSLLVANRHRAETTGLQEISHTPSAIMMPGVRQNNVSIRHLDIRGSIGARPLKFQSKRILDPRCSA
jgi:hypothetical protein